MLASSREGLNIAGGTVFHVPSLSLPELDQVNSIETVAQSEAARLFIERARAVLPGFRLTNDNAPAVAQVCHQLDGIPLAIELAAARVKLLQVEQIAERLEDRFQLLTGGSRTALLRHQTLTALIDWSYDLLSEPERVLLRRLSVFAGGWALEAAETVGAGEGTEPDAILDLLTQLVNKSLVVAERAQGEEARYRMLETIRQYALEKLTASGEADAVRRWHAAYYLALAEAIMLPNLMPSTWLDRMEMEHDNLRAALTWSQSATGSAELGLRLVRAIQRFWFPQGYWSEARIWLAGALAQAEGVGDIPARAEMLAALGEYLTFQSDYSASQAHFIQSLKLFQELGDLPWSAWVLERLGWLAREYGDATTARLRLEESLALFRELEDKAGIAGALVTLGEVAVMQEDAAWATALLEEGLAVFREQEDTVGIGWALNHLGHVAQLQGGYGRATQLHEEGLAQFRETGWQSLGVAWAHQSLGETALAQGEAAFARTHLVEALGFFRDSGDRAGMAWCLAGLAGVAAVNEDPERAAWLWGAAEALRQSIGARTAPAARATHERLMAEVRAQLDEAAFNAAWAEGQAASPEQAIAYALGEEA